MTQHSTPMYLPKRIQSMNSQICQCSQQHHSQELKGINNTNVHQHVNGLIKRGK